MKKAHKIEHRALGIGLRASFLFILAPALSCPERVYEVDRTEMGFGSYIRIRALGRDSVAVVKTVNRAFSELHRLDSLLSFFSEESEVVRLNRSRRMVVAPETRVLILKALEIGEKTHGKFDITVEPLMRLWGFYDEKFRVPESSEIAKLLPKVDFHQVEIKGDTVFLNEGVNIDLGGIAVGYAVDRAVEILKEGNVKEGLVDAGGDISVFGEREWRIGIQNPRGEGVLRILKLKNCAVATSGDYEKFFERWGKRYCHILNPKTGYPADAFVSVTVVAATALAADAYSTTVFVMGPDEGERWVKEQGLEAVLFRQQGDSLIIREVR